jgi:hypothetical protein
MPDDGKINVSFSASAEDVISRFMKAVERTGPHPSLVPIIIWWIEGTSTDKATGKVTKLGPSIDVGAIDPKDLADELRAGSVCLSSFSGLISGMPAGVQAAAICDSRLK